MAITDSKFRVDSVWCYKRRGPLWKEQWEVSWFVATKHGPQTLSKRFNTFPEAIAFATSIGVKTP